MNRAEWKEFHRALRSRRGDACRAEMINHGGTYWTVSYVPSSFSPHSLRAGLHCTPSIIRDRATSALLAVELAWTRQYRSESQRHRRNGSYWAGLAMNSVRAALACIGDCRAWRASASTFHRLPG